MASPSGEARCAYCGRWFNVHSARVDMGRVPSEDGPAPLREDCPHCLEGLDPRTPVSPHGDVKCGHCHAWFNVHGRRTEDGVSSEPDLRCPRCSAPVTNQVEVAPSGDARCSYCGFWFNVTGGRKP